MDQKYDIHELLEIPRLNPGILSGILRGIERETLRIDDVTGKISSRKHPKALGSTLCNKYITTDFSEGLLEFVTPPFSNPKQLINFLFDLHKFTYDNLEDELLWPYSMPPSLQNTNIPIADYGSSNTGKMKVIYREGLKNRYGNHMQVIAGTHYNLSFPSSFWKLLKKREKGTDNLAFKDYVSRKYMGLIRNYHRNNWIVPFLFGASPCIDCSFTDKIPSTFEIKKNTAFNKSSTSLRMTDLGYYNDTGIPFEISYNSLREYFSGLDYAIATKDPKWHKIGVKDTNGNYLQLSDSILQIANEYYGGIRPKTVAKPCESPQRALRRGIEYVELRSIDLNPFSEIGINEEQIFFFDILLTYCALIPSGNINPIEQEIVDSNLHSILNTGLDPNTTIDIGGKQITPAKAFEQKLAIFHEIASILDQSCDTNLYGHTIKNIANKLSNNNQSYARKVLTYLENEKLSFHESGIKLAKTYRKKFANYKLSSTQQEMLNQEAIDSLKQQNILEMPDHITLEDYISNYYRP